MNSVEDSPITGTQRSRDDSQQTSQESIPRADVEAQTTVEDSDDDQNSDNEDGEDEEEEDDDDDDDDDDRFPYTVAELATIFTGFYQFLTKLHFDPAFLRLPPPDGWPELSREITGNWKDDFALEVLRHLPYFDRGGYVPVDYHSRLVDYSSFDPGFFQETDWNEEYMDFERFGSLFQPRMSFIIAEGRESYGQQWIFDAEHGTIYAEQIRADSDGPFDVGDFFASIMQKYRNLHLISSGRRSTIDASRVPERTDRITEQEVLAQKDEFFETELDVQFLRQVCRDYGWPDVFRRVECRAYIDDFMLRVEQARGELSAWSEDVFIPKEGDTKGTGYLMEGAAAKAARKRQAESSSQAA